MTSVLSTAGKTTTRTPRTILEADEFVKSHFSRKQIVTMGRAVEDHRASNQKKPRNGYGMIVAEADRFIDADTIFRRTIQYGLANYPQPRQSRALSADYRAPQREVRSEGLSESLDTMERQRKNLKKLHVLLTDRKELEEIFNRIFDEENE